jgi:NitT/TauT family transport system substrate-binding protein
VQILEKRGNGQLVTIDTNLDGPYRNLSCCMPGIRPDLIQNEPDVARALTQAILEAAKHVANDPDDAGAVFAQYAKLPAGDLAAILRTHTHHHHRPGPELMDELAVYLADMKLIGVLRPSTDPQRFASRIHCNVSA